MANKHWTEDEIARLKQIMTRYEIDKEGCMYAAKELGRSFNGVHIKWLSIKPNKREKLPRKNTAEILYANVSKYPGNLSEAFRVTAKQTGKSTTYVSNIYYQPDSPYNHHKVDTCFMMASKHRMASNAKNYDSSKMPKTTKQRIKSWIANIFNIRKEDL